MKHGHDLGALLPHVTISLSLAVGVMVILDFFNPRMGFLTSTYSRIILVLMVGFALASGIRSAAQDRKTQKDRRPR